MIINIFSKYIKYYLISLTWRQSIRLITIPANRWKWAAASNPHVEISMKYLVTLLLVFPAFASAQAIYDANGLYKGYTQTTPSGVTTTYTPSGQSVGSSQIDNGQTNYYSPNGAYAGTNTTTPAPSVPNTTVNTPRQAPQAPAMKGWWW